MGISVKSAEPGLFHNQITLKDVLQDTPLALHLPPRVVLIKVAPLLLQIEIGPLKLAIGCVLTLTLADFPLPF